MAITVSPVIDPDQKSIHFVELDNGASGFLNSVFPWPAPRKEGGVPADDVPIKVNTKLPPELKVVVVVGSPSENMGNAVATGRPRKVASVIPARRKLVKTMMYESIAESVSSFFFSGGPPDPSDGTDDHAITDGGN